MCYYVPGRAFHRAAQSSCMTLPEFCLQGKLLVGGELAEPEGRLSKAQKKNMKRMEKKAAARASTDVSVASSEVRC